MAPLTSIKIDNRIAYVPGSPCRRGADDAVVMKSADSTRGWVDIGGDGTIDAIRAGDQVYASSALAPEWGVTTKWIAVPGDKKDPVATLASRSGPIATAVGTLIDPTPFSDNIIQAEVIGSGVGTRGGTDMIDGASATRFDFIDDQDPGGGRGAKMSVWVDDQDTLRRLSTTVPGQDPRGLVTVTSELRGTNEPVDVAVPAQSDTTPFAGIPAAPVAMDNAFLNPDCDADPHGVEAQRACVVAAATQKTVADYAKENVATPFGCATPTGTTPN